MILSDERLKEFLAQLGQAFQRTGLVTAHQGGVADQSVFVDFAVQHRSGGDRLPLRASRQTLPYLVR